MHILSSERCKRWNPTWEKAWKNRSGAEVCDRISVILSNLVDNIILRNSCKMITSISISNSFAKIGCDTAENEARQVSCETRTREP